MKRFLEEIAHAVGARLAGDGRIEVNGVASVESATSGDLVFVDDEKHLVDGLRSPASALIAGEFAASVSSPKPLLITDHPKLAFARAARLLQECVSSASGKHSVHATALIHSSVVLGDGAR